MGIRTTEQIRKLKRDTEGKYDRGFGNMYREREGISTALTHEVIAKNEMLNEIADIILNEAIQLEARNIDISKETTGYGIVRLRIGRDMVDYRILDPDSVDGLSIVFRKRADVNIEQNYRSEINGSIRHFYRGNKYDLRCAFIPSTEGMTTSIRILYSSSMMLDISQLGLPKPVEYTLRESLKSRQGMILLTGATASGKTTTQYTGLSTIMKSEGTTRNIRSVENPVEYTLEGIKQTQVNEEAGETFSKVLRSFLRGDPDVILVGEINDSETALTSVRAATSGHLVMSTLHTNNTIQVTRVMQHYGASYIDLGNALQLVIYQTLENKLCDRCKKKRMVSEDEFNWIKKRLGVDDNITVLYEPTGEVDGEECPDCLGNGFKGASLVVEMLETDYVYQRALNEAKDDTYKLEKLIVNDPDANYYPIGRDVFRHLKEGNIDIGTAKRIMKKQTGNSAKDTEGEVD